MGVSSSDFYLRAHRQSFATLSIIACQNTQVDLCFETSCNRKKCAVYITECEWDAHTMQHTSPQPCAEVTLLKAKLMVPPPFPLWVDKEPDKTAVSFVVRGA